MSPIGPPNDFSMSVQNFNMTSLCLKLKIENFARANARQWSGHRAAKISTPKLHLPRTHLICFWHGMIPKMRLIEKANKHTRHMPQPPKVPLLPR